VAGTAAARGNDGTGVAGVTWRSSLIPLKVLGADGSGPTAMPSVPTPMHRAGAQIINLSLGGGTSVWAERDAIASLPDVLFIVAAGNQGADNDATGSYPCNYDLPNVVCVGATDAYDRLASFSNFGTTTVDLAAPGVGIASTYPRADGSYAYLSGTSMATPHVTGVAALLLARAPDTSVAGLREALLSSVDPLAGLDGRTVTGGRLNAAGALAALGGSPQPQNDRRLGFGRVTRPGVLARTTARRTSAGTVTRPLRLSATERRRLSRAWSVRLTVRVRATDPAGNTRNRIIHVSLRR